MYLSRLYVYPLNWHCLNHKMWYLFVLSCKSYCLVFTFLQSSLYCDIALLFFLETNCLTYDILFLSTKRSIFVDFTFNALMDLVETQNTYNVIDASQSSKMYFILYIYNFYLFVLQMISNVFNYHFSCNVRK